MSQIFDRLKALRWQDWLAVVVLAAGVGMLVSQCASLGNRRVDDAYITFSFSKRVSFAALFPTAIC